MTSPVPLLSRRTSLLVQVETTYDGGPAGGTYNPATDSVLLLTEAYTPDFTLQPRKLLHPSLSRLPHVMGRKLGKYKITGALTGNGRCQSGLIGDVPIHGRLLQACGMVQTLQPTSWVSAVMPLADPLQSTGVSVAWGTGGTLTPTHPVGYLLTVTTGGTSGAAEISVTPHDTTLDTPQINVPLISGTSTTIGSLGLRLTPTWSGSLPVGENWWVVIYPPGVNYSPISSSFSSVCMRLAMDGAVHDVTGAMGTFMIKADAGQQASLEFGITGRYIPYANAALPAYTSLELAAPIFEKATLSLAGFQPLITSLSVDLGAVPSIRESANSADGYFGVYISDRETKGGIDPEATLQTNYDFWGSMASSKMTPFCARIGYAVPGNRVFLMCPGTQYTGLTYKDRSGIRAMDAAVAMNQIFGDDELNLFFY